MSLFLFAWALCATVAAFVVLGVIVALEVRDHLAAAVEPVPAPMPVPHVPEQRRPAAPAAVVVEVLDAQSFEEFLAELIVTPHVEAALS